ncbi:hypothetical protein GGR56DRAFT_695433 [Xylariaceae sp. FL0804]|nr:hypothetical protein GGR56DRAFT_695433 [Xylariaceae sp. FL0804]
MYLSCAALNTLSEALRVELAPFGVSVVTILPGVVDSRSHINGGADFDLPPTSRYAAIRDIIAGWAQGEAQPKDGISAERFAELVVSDVVGTSKGGLDFILSQNQGLSELSQSLKGNT